MRHQPASALGLAGLLFAATLSAQATTSTPETAPATAAPTTQPAATAPAATVTVPAESELVKAAKKGPVKRKKSRISITDRDIKTTTGKLTVVSSSGQVAPPSGLTMAETAQMENDEKRRNREATEGRIMRAQKEIAALEKELGKLEEDYYAEDNPDYRDHVLESRYDSTKSQLDRVRHELTLAREDLQKYQ